jgi:hypothetical protein
MKRSALGIVTILAAFTMFGCGDLDFAVPCWDDPPIDTCNPEPEIIDTGLECNMAIPFGSICDFLPPPIRDLCDEHLGGLLGDGWLETDGTCQVPLEGGEPCTEDNDCENTCDIDVCT